MKEICRSCGVKFETGLSWNLGIVDCKKCATKNAGPKLVKRSDRRPGKSAVDEAFDNLRLNKKMMKEQGLTKEKILSELESGTKPRDEVTIGGVAGRLGKVEK